MPADREQVEKTLSEVLEVITSREYIDQMNKVREAPVDERLAAGAKYLTPEALREAGVDVPEGFRISSRYFDEELGRELEFGQPYEQPNVITRLSDIEPDFLDRIRIKDPALFDEMIELPEQPSPMAACGCGGAFSVCGGAGWD
ncbi:hypothetical protein [Halalkalicoccus sp. NIPERK01]|uniref:hypothetical protein n=1 Tax=Halalkalicoccus sp. NIPERK01 TaxID=3053469 RepID=UPI00256EFA4F|nr:hypothetical protein [Halalkalicoccus sp. NIPERK01]MDL5363417.1 hypothetical protein [Halalkalicoccus sp. NIPERK01]